MDSNLKPASVLVFPTDSSAAHKQIARYIGMNEKKHNNKKTIDETI